MPKILIERATNRCRVTILTARPGVVIGRKGSEIDKLKEELSRKTGKEVYVDIVEVKQPELDAQLVAENIALQLERRVSFRRAMKKALQTAKDFGAEGIKLRAAGRLGGAELARVEMYHWGRVPLHTLRADIDYGLPRRTRFTANSASSAGFARVRTSRRRRKSKAEAPAAN